MKTRRHRRTREGPRSSNSRRSNQRRRRPMAARKSTSARNPRRSAKRPAGTRATKRAGSRDRLHATLAPGGSAQAALKGRASKGLEMTPDLTLGPATMAAGAGVQERREPRPYTTRYPIPDKQFAQLK